MNVPEAQTYFQTMIRPSFPWLPDIELRQVQGFSDRFGFDNADALNPAKTFIEWFDGGDYHYLWHEVGHAILHHAALIRDLTLHHGDGAERIFDEFAAVIGVTPMFAERAEHFADGFARSQLRELAFTGVGGYPWPTALFPYNALAGYFKTLPFRLMITTDPAGFFLSFPITQVFGVPEPIAPTSFHTGIDLGMPSGTLVPSLFAGSVRWAGYDSISGYSIKVQSPSGVVWWYAHLSSLAVQTGDTVSRGQTIGLSGATGAATGPHLHLEKDVGGKPVDPYEEVLMLSDEAKAELRVIVREEVGVANADIDTKINSAFNATLPVMLRREHRGHDPAGDHSTNPPSTFPDDTTPL